MIEERHSVFSIEQRDEIKDLMHEALTEYFAQKGSVAKQIIIGTAILVGSITVVLGGVKTILSWIGIGYIDIK